MFVKIKHVVYGVFGGGLLALIASFFMRLEIAIAIGIAGFLLMAYSALIGDNIKIIVDDGWFSVFKGKKEKYRFNLNEVSIFASIKTTDGDSDCMLTVEEAAGEKTFIDCSMLGRNRFYKLLDTLGVTEPNPVQVITKKKGSK
jgi:hypothetical protein